LRYAEALINTSLIPYLLVLSYLNSTNSLVASIVFSIAIINVVALGASLKKLELLGNMWIVPISLTIFYAFRIGFGLNEGMAYASILLLTVALNGREIVKGMSNGFSAALVALIASAIAVTYLGFSRLSFYLITPIMESSLLSVYRDSINIVVIAAVITSLYIAFLPPSMIPYVVAVLGTKAYLALRGLSSYGAVADYILRPVYGGLIGFG